MGQNRRKQAEVITAVKLVFLSSHGLGRMEISYHHHVGKHRRNYGNEGTIPLLFCCVFLDSKVEYTRRMYAGPGVPGG